MKQLITGIFVLFFLEGCMYTPPSGSLGHIKRLASQADSLDSVLKTIHADTLRFYYSVMSKNMDTLKILFGNTLIDSSSMRIYGSYATINKTLKRTLPNYEKYAGQIRYSQFQLRALKNDIEKGNIKSDSLIMKYIRDEELTLENCVRLYHHVIAGLPECEKEYFLLQPQIEQLKYQWRIKKRIKNQ